MSIAKRVAVIGGFSETQGFIDPITEAIIDTGLVEDRLNNPTLRAKHLKSSII